jgi:aryl-alcohol dehydrogenase-like predicted oxidoreductase
MIKRKLATGIEVAPLAFGGNVFGWTIDEEKSFELLDAFVDAGFNLIDTADVYSHWKPGNKGGESETIIGKWFKQRRNRDKVIIATKVGGAVAGGKKSLTRQHILQAVEDSLQRLQTDYIDLYQSHWDDLDTPVAETMETYAELVKQGKVRAIGASNLSAERLIESIRYSETHGLPRYETLQPEYNLYKRRKYEQEYEPICLEKGLGVINYYALASGFLTGKYRNPGDVDKSARGGGVVKSYLNDRGLRILNALDEVAKDYNTTPASIAIAWLLARPSITAPIASATSIEQLDDLLEAAQLNLDQQAIGFLNKASEGEEVEVKR